MDKNEKRQKRYTKMADSSKKVLLQKRREMYAGKKVREKDILDHYESRLDNNIKENWMILEGKNLDPQSQLPSIRDESSLLMPSPSHFSSTMDKNEEHKKKYTEIPQNLKQQLLNKCRET
ncbi:hypothetical protein ACH5RR_025479 [Cinchona calisaya]|uniref:Uncharacterized protein n=1 Tax=Cinchona calisaya TaxID=153742 RepID=A0ABD2Z3S8_9GENT